MRRSKNILCMLFIVHATLVTAQTRGELRDMFVSAEGDILFEDYAEALPKYLNLLKIYPQNFNYYYRIGQCYINTPGEKDKSISYLETASQHINPKYREGKFREAGAPRDALYYLANAYRINDNLEKAIETYYLFLENINTDVYDTSIVNQQIKSCIVAREMMSDPVYVVEKNLGEVVNERFSEFNPVVSADEKLIVFTRELQFYDAVFYSRMVNNRWMPAINMTPELGVDQDYYSSSLTGDGKTLLLYKTDNYEGNIYMSRFENDRWTPVEKLNDNINTKYWESHATLSADGNRLYFTSNRKESLGGLDIFISERDSTGDWGVPSNLGPVINTPYNEEAPFLANNGRTLFFCSRGHRNMGGYDIFRSDLDQSGKWSEPVNLGYPVNTTDDDLFFTPADNVNRGYYAKFDPSGYGRKDIFHYEIFSESNPRNFFVTGNASISNLLADFPEQISVTAVNNADAGKIVSAVSDPITGYYSLRLPQGSFTFTYSGEGASDISKTIRMPLTHKGDTVTIDPVILPNSDFIADLRLLEDTTLRVISGDPLLFNLEVEPRSFLTIGLYSADSLIHSETHRIIDNTFTFRFLPPQGDARLLFGLTDRFGNKASASVTVNRTDVARITKPQYEKLMARKQIGSLLEVLKKYADDDLRKVLNTIDPAKEKLGTSDDLLSLIKEKALDAGIPTVTIDKLALEVALREGILTQAAVDIMHDRSAGPVHDALTGLNIYDNKLKNWNDLVTYVTNRSGGAVTGEDLKRLAEYILMDPDPGINTIREKVLYASAFSDDSTAVREAVTSVDRLDLKYAGEWLYALTDDCRNRGIGNTGTRITSALSYKPGTKVSGLLADLMLKSTPDLKEHLGNLHLKSMKIRRPEDLVMNILEAATTGKVKAQDAGEAVAAIIIEKDLSKDEIRENMKEPWGFNWLCWLAVIGLLVIIYVIWRNRGRNRSNGETT